MSNRAVLWEQEATIAFVGNPNVGKSTLFNYLTGLDQHTGNWPGKTVSIAQGSYSYKGKKYRLIDLPGTYSLSPVSEEEQVTSDFLASGDADCIVVVADASCLERSVWFALQVLQQYNNVIFCVNLMDEARKRGIHIDVHQLSSRLCVPVIGTTAADGEGIGELKEAVRNISDGFVRTNKTTQSFHGEGSLHVLAAEICTACVSGGEKTSLHWFDRIALHRYGGKLLMLLLVFSVLWLTIYGANYASGALEYVFDYILHWLKSIVLPLPVFVAELLVDGILKTVLTVISVMLPPLLIFFPLFSLLEDFGYLPRVAFMTDHIFSKCGSCGKQALTMSLGIGCNAVAVTGTRIISSPKERTAAILTNSFMPCNGRFPTLITLIAIFFSSNPAVAAVILFFFLLLSVCISLLATKFIATVNGNDVSEFILEMPPYRRPRFLLSLKRAVWEKTMFMLSRAVMVSAPAGAVIWILSNAVINGSALTSVISSWLDPVGIALGMNGMILLAFILSLPANELFLPLLVSLISAEQLIYATDIELSQLLYSNGWTWQIALCTIIFLLFHWPCSTTILTIYSETKSFAKTVLSVLIPTGIGAVLCFIVQLIFR